MKHNTIYTMINFNRSCWKYFQKLDIPKSCQTYVSLVWYWLTTLYDLSWYLAFRKSGQYLTSLSISYCCFIKLICDTLFRFSSASSCFSSVFSRSAANPDTGFTASSKTWVSPVAQVRLAGCCCCCRPGRPAVRNTLILSFRS